MSKAAHTPTPWLVVTGADPQRRTIIARGVAGHPAVAETRSEGFGSGCKPDFANADFIVLACNTYEAIKDALGTDEDGEALVEVARNAHRAERELAALDVICQAAADAHIDAELAEANQR